MSVYLGDSGAVEIRRSAVDDGLLGSFLDPDDVNPLRRRFSFDFPPEALITGDQMEIRTEDGSDLELVQGHVAPDGRWYVHVDDAGGIRLYDNYVDALNGELDNALELVVPSRSIPIAVHVRNSAYRCTSQMRSWELTTSRETVDTTVLGEEHRRQYGAGLISGQGTMSCLWDYTRSLCDPNQPDTSLHIEEPHYFAQLVLRLKQGARFDGRFYIHRGDIRQMVWWESACVVTNVGFAFSPGAPIETRIEFVTTGPIHLRMGMPPAYLLQEDADRLLLEDGRGFVGLEDPT